MTAIGVEEALRLRRWLNKLVRKFNAAATDEDLTPSQASVLGLIAMCGPIGVGELVELEQINPTMLSRIVGRLDAAGLIVRHRIQTTCAPRSGSNTTRSTDT